LRAYTEVPEISQYRNTLFFFLLVPFKAVPMRFNAMGPALLPLRVSTAENDVVKWYVGRSAVVPDFQGFPLKNALKDCDFILGNKNSQG
jgi:hypothetical protein